MKKTSNLLAIALTAIALFLGNNAKAQVTPPNAWRLGFGIEGGIPTGSLNSFSNFELGGTARLQYGLGNNTVLTFTSGYYEFFASYHSRVVPLPANTYVDGVLTNSTTITNSNSGLIPVKVGVKEFFTKNLYFGAEAGAGFRVTGYNKNVKLILSPALGFADKSWDVSVRYENFSGSNDSYGLVALRIAYGFKL